MVDELNPNSRSAFVDSNGRLTKYGQDTILLLYRAVNPRNTGGTTLDDILFGNVDISDADGITSARERYLFSEQNEDYLTISDEIVVIRAEITVTLNQNPHDREEVVIRNPDNYDFTVSGGGRLINGFSSMEDPCGYVKLVYFVELNEWLTLSTGKKQITKVVSAAETIAFDTIRTAITDRVMWEVAIINRNTGVRNSFTVNATHNGTIPTHTIMERGRSGLTFNDFDVDVVIASNELVMSVTNNTSSELTVEALRQSIDIRS